MEAVDVSANSIASFRFMLLCVQQMASVAFDVIANECCEYRTRCRCFDPPYFVLVQDAGDIAPVVVIGERFRHRYIKVSRPS